MKSKITRILLTLSALGWAGFAEAADRPNILWITSEDNGHYIGCFGDPVARTPNVDWLARGGTRYRNCFSNAAVCAPARQTLITGMYATSLGGQHMRSTTKFPAGVHYFPKYLRDLGYHTSNNSKTDYNGSPGDGKRAMTAAWDESGKKAHWRNRTAGKPFFSVFNIGSSHESQLFPNKWKKRKLKTDPAKVKLPAYLPDLPETRLDLARYYDCLESMDEQVGKILRELKDDGPAEDTIVFYFGDHGGSMPRGKSFTYDSGTRVPLVVHIPERWKALRASKPGGESDRLVSFVDFAPTILSLVKLDAPDYMQGRPFLGYKGSQQRDFVHTFRGRRGERYDIVRGVRSKRFLYLRNYTPHLPVMQFNGYSFAIPGYSAWMNAWQDGRCSPEQAQWFEPKASEELYAVDDDPDNIHNLAANPPLAETLKAMRAENDRHLLAIRDSVFFPEGMSGRNHAAYQSDDSYPLNRLLALATKVSNRSNVSAFETAMKDSNPCVRYWGVMGCIVLGKRSAPADSVLRELLKDPESLIRIQAARALAGSGQTAAAVDTLRKHLNSKDQILQLRAVLAVDECDLLPAEPSLRLPLQRIRSAYAKRVSDRLLQQSPTK
ncbi:MAG: sulfatase-like hydrolase/transferase [Verrucomicrobiia bacterium]|jgi:N-sulfoglucosamine sulfohydrolase